MAERETVGVVGTGIMGAPMARNLAKAGFEVIAYNRTASRAEALRADGVAVAATIAEVGATASVVITMVPDTPDVLAVVEGEGGLAGAMSEGSVLIDMSTISPAETRALAGRLAERGIGMLDAPVSGGSWGAQQGTLTIMVGGEQETFERCLPVFEAMGKSITLMGPSGMGQTTKLVNQILVAGTCAAVAEALVFAASQGADLLKTVEAVSGGAAGSWQLVQPGASDGAAGLRARLHGEAAAEGPAAHPGGGAGRARAARGDEPGAAVPHRGRGDGWGRRGHAGHREGGGAARGHRGATGRGGLTTRSVTNTS